MWARRPKANSQCALITSLPMGRFYLKFFNCIPVFLNCISPMYFSTVILYCISLPYFSTVFCHCPKQILSVLLSPVCEWTDRVTKWEISHTEKKLKSNKNPTKRAYFVATFLQGCICELCDIFPTMQTDFNKWPLRDSASQIVVKTNKYLPL